MIGREKNLELSKEERDARAENRVGGLRVENSVGKTRGKTWHLVTDIFTPGLTAGNPLALPALNHSIVFGRRARFMPASTLHYGARGGPTDRPRGVEGEGERGRKGEGDRTESGRVGFYSPRARHIVYPKNTLRAHAIAWHAALRRRESISPTSPTSLGQAIDIRDRDRGAMSTSSVSMNVRMDNA